MNNYYIVTKGEHKGMVGIKHSDHPDKKLCYLSDVANVVEVIVPIKSLKPAGLTGEKKVIDQQVIRKVNEIKDLLIKKKRLDMPKPTDEEIKKLLACIETEE